MTRGLRADDLFRLNLVAEPQLSADGCYLAYVRRRLDRATDGVIEEIVVKDLADGAEWRPSPGGRRARAPRWAPDGRLAFLCDASGIGQLWLWIPGDMPPAQLTEDADEVVDLDWSADGCKIAITRTWQEDPGTAITDGPWRRDGQAGLALEHRRVQVVPTDGSPGSGLAAWDVPCGATGAWFPRWSPDTERLAFLAGQQLQVVAGPDAEPWAAPGRGPVLAFAWGPSGRDIAYLAPREPEDADVDARLFRWRVGAAEPVELAGGWDRSLGSAVQADDGRGTGPPALAWSAATGRIYFTVADGGRGRLGWADPSDGSYGYLLGGDRTCLDPTLDHDGRLIAFVSTSPAEPGDVHLVGADGSGERRVTDANRWLRTLTLPRTRPVTANSSGGGPVEGWVTALDNDGGPAGRPLVVSVHGGPHYAVGWRFSFEAQRLAARGYAVLTANPVGSGGYGRRFARAIRGAWGTADWPSLERLIDSVAATPGIDADRIAITGVSYGGYLAMWAATRSDRFSAVISENGIGNLLAEWGMEQDGEAWLTAELGGPPWERPEAYVAASPIAAAHQIRAPLLLIHAELDRNCPISQSEQMFAALRFLGRNTELFVVQGEGHLMNLVGRPSSRLARAQAVDRWLGRHLRQEGGIASDGPQ
jgi:dipeptidyl aminopeptidase/acylaminoacyl peptidase